MNTTIQFSKISASNDLLNRTESRIDCFVINTTPIRSDIEFISRKYWEVLTYSLRSSILKDLTTLQDFLNTSSHVLQTVTVMEEQYIEESAIKCEQIINELPMVKVICHICICT